VGDKLEFRIEFLDETRAAIELTIRAPEARHAYGEVLLFSSIALRQMHNMGTNHPVSRSLAQALASLADPALPMRVLLGAPQLSMQRFREAMREGAPDPMDNIVSTDVITLVPFTRQKGKKRFLGTLDFDPGRARFLLHPKGFNAMGEGVNYYAPLSVAVLLRFLSRSGAEDPTYQSQLRRVANACGDALLSGQVTTLSQPALALAITERAMSEP
jgi:hypothetical protein